MVNPTSEGYTANHTHAAAATDSNLLTVIDAMTPDI